MARISRYLDEEVVSKAREGIKQLGKSGIVSRKLQYVILAKEHGITKVCEFCNITKRSLIRWIKEIKLGSIELLQVQKGRGRKCKLTKEQEKVIGDYVVNNSNATLEEIKQYIKKNFGVSLSVSSVHRIIKKT